MTTKARKISLTETLVRGAIAVLSQPATYPEDIKHAKRLLSAALQEIAKPPTREQVFARAADVLEGLQVSNQIDQLQVDGAIEILREEAEIAAQEAAEEEA